MDIEEIDNEEDDDANDNDQGGDGQPVEDEGAEGQGAGDQNVNDAVAEVEEASEADVDAYDEAASVVLGAAEEEIGPAAEADGDGNDDEVYSHSQQLAFAYEQQLDEQQLQQLDGGDEIVFEEQDSVEVVKEQDSVEPLVETVDDDDVPMVAPLEQPMQQPINARYGLRPNRQLNFNYRYDHQTFMQSAEALLATEFNPQAFHHLVCGYVMNQMTAKQGIRKHGQVAVEALFKESAQLDNKGIFAPIDSSKLTKEQKHQALWTINVIKEKRCGMIKGRSCADGWMQRVLYAKHETASPTLSNNALMLLLIVDAVEERHVATADVAGANLNADMVDFVLMKLEDEIVDIMCQVNPAYIPFVVMERGRKVLYVQLMKVLYGCVKSALLWYQLFVSTLQGQGFELNPFDVCIANKMVDGKQCTVIWYVDDTKISHEDSQVVSDVIAAIEEKFGKMTVMQGKAHNFLGMDIEFKDNKMVQVQMTEYLKAAIRSLESQLQERQRVPQRELCLRFKRIHLR
ncbi:hypothetical protein ACA910_014438 [Epithemia clementina (nom. ined.)]